MTYLQNAAATLTSSRQTVIARPKTTSKDKTDDQR